MSTFVVVRFCVAEADVHVLAKEYPRVIMLLAGSKTNSCRTLPC